MKYFFGERIANTFEVSLDYLVGDAENKIDKATLNRIQQVDKMKPDDKKMIYAFLDAFITKTRLQAIL